MLFRSELAYIRGRLSGLQTADEQLESSVQENAAKTVVVTKEIEVARLVMEDRLYFIGCKIKNKQEKTVYTTMTVKARTNEDALNQVEVDCRIKHNTLIKSVIIKSYGTDTMQYQFGIGSKEVTTLTALGKKML